MRYVFERLRLPERLLELVVAHIVDRNAALRREAEREGAIVLKNTLSGRASEAIRTMEMEN